MFVSRVVGEHFVVMVVSNSCSRAQIDRTSANGAANCFRQLHRPRRHHVWFRIEDDSYFRRQRPVRPNFCKRYVFLRVFIRTRTPFLFGDIGHLRRPNGGQIVCPSQLICAGSSKSSGVPGDNGVIKSKFCNWRVGLVIIA